MSAADRRPSGPLAVLTHLIRGLGPGGAVANVAEVLDAREQSLTAVEQRLVRITVNRSVPADAA